VKPAPLFGRFLELALPTADIAASVQFYERLGFRQHPTGDAWPHPYGVLGDGRIHLGLHQTDAFGLAPGFVLPELSRWLAVLSSAGLTPEALHLGEESMHHLQLRDPGGNPVRLQEARSFSPIPGDAESLCGYFLHLSLPEDDFSAARAFWELGGWVALPEEDSPYPHLPLTADQLDLAFHARRSLPSACLVFECPDLPAALARLQQRHITPLPQRPRLLAVAGGALLQAPEGTLLWLLPAVQDTHRETALASA
jgi:catechol 2,3-dioxygenase-like lactoylglutathione lyase family enzyme